MGFLLDLFKIKSKEDYLTLIKNGGRVVDVRTSQEFRSGHAKGSLNIPLDVLGKNIKTIKAMRSPVILVCRSGTRASMALKELKKQGVEVYNAGSWLNLK